MDRSNWISSLKKYEGGDSGKSLFQLMLTLFCYSLLVSSMFYLVYTGKPYWISLLLAVPAAGFHIKTFIIMHDCGHNSYFKNPGLCTLTGRICGLITFTPYYDWRRSHAIHHASVSNLDKRGIGDVWTLTVEEYRSSPVIKKMIYRIFRNPVFLFGIAPVFLFLIIMRFPHDNMSRKELKSILLTDLMLGIIITALSLLFGFPVVLKVILPIVFLSTMGGVWLFYVQHQFENVYWAHSSVWSLEKAALNGSSYYKLPGIINWFSGNIGLHHIHHLNSRIPNYNLRKCFREIPQVKDIKPITFFHSIKLAFLNLWDEKSGKLINFRALRRI